MNPGQLAAWLAAVGFIVSSLLALWRLWGHRPLRWVGIYVGTVLGGYGLLVARSAVHDNPLTAWRLLHFPHMFGTLLLVWLVHRYHTLSQQVHGGEGES